MFKKLAMWLFGEAVKEMVVDELVAINVSIDNLESNFSELKSELEALGVKVEDYHDNPAPPPPLDGIPNFKELPMAEWASHVNGSRVGYVKVGQDAILCKVLNDNSLYPYENDDLRDGTNTNAKRIILKENGWAMVYAKGNVYADIFDPDKKVRPFGFDGGSHGYLVMAEQIIDGIDLEQKPDEEYVPLYIWAKPGVVVDVFYQTEDIRWED